jgi:iron complex transport system substrate-binding protein
MKNNVLKRITIGFVAAGLLLTEVSFTGCADKTVANIQKDALVVEKTETAENNEIIENVVTESLDVEVTVSEVTFTDALGREVIVSKPERVVTLLGSFCDLWLLAGGGVVGTAKDSWTAFDLNLSEDVVNIGSIMSPDLEQIIALEPDFVIASAGTDAQVELLDSLEGAGINVAYFEVSNFDEYLNVLGTFTEITGKSENYEKYGTEIAKEIEEQKKKAAAALEKNEAQPTVLFIRAAASNVKAKGSKGTVGGEILADLGTVNIADSEKGLLEDLSLEAIVAEDPDYIFVTTQGEDTEAALANVEELLKNHPAWSSLTAVKNGNYYEIDKSLYNSKPNARWGEAYKILADILYGDN